MERIRRARRPERAAVTKILIAIEAQLLQVPINRIELEASLHTLDRHLNKLGELDDSIKEALLDNEDTTEEEMDRECESIEEYQTRATLVKVKINSALTSDPRLESPRQSISNSHVLTTKRNFKLPIIELRTFSGELKEWLGWWAQFEKIHKDEELHESDKFTYLIQSMCAGSRAYELVTSYPQSRENYPKVVMALKERYGNAKLLKQVYIRELIHMITSRTKETKQLSTLYDKLESHLRSLASLGVSVEQMTVFLFPMVESSLPEEILLAWQRSLAFGKDETTENPPRSELDFLMAFLKQEIDNEEQRRLAQNGFGSSTDKRRSSRRKEFHEEEDVCPTSAGLFSGNPGKSTCLFCDKSHESKDCFKAQRMSMEDKRERLKKRGVCFTCLMPGHISKKCRTPVKCPVCGKKHVVLFCPEILPKKSSKSAQMSQEIGSTVQSNLNCTSEVILRTMRVKAFNPATDTSKIVRVLVDCGSQRSYILRTTMMTLGLTPIKTVTINHSLFGGGEVTNQTHDVFDLSVCSLQGRKSFHMRVLDQERICGTIPRMEIGIWMSELKANGVYISDLDSQNPSEVELLIGADYLGQILTGNIIQLTNGLTVTETLLGWTLMGRTRHCDQGRNIAMTVINMSLISVSIAELWKLESIGISDPSEIQTREEYEQMAHRHFLENVKQKPDGRYSVSLPWITGVTDLPDNRVVASRRLESTTKKLLSIDKFSDYDKVFKSWEAEGVISRVEISNQSNNPCHYLPHRAVLKPESKSTPIRPVFDASGKSGRVPSLNDCLEKGPNLLELIPSILMRFRMGRIGVTADIRKAFLMIEVNESDREFLRFLWWKDAERKQLLTYRHNRVVFGMNCSPFLLGAVIRHHLSGVNCKEDEIVKKMKTSLYVDNLVIAVNSMDEFRRLKMSSTALLAQARMDLRQWECTGVVSGDPITNVLGLRWDNINDTLSCARITDEMPSNVTKRIMLSELHQIFDPLGFLSPVLLIPKLLLQKAWSENKSWDERLSDETKREFINWHCEMKNLLEAFKIPRDCLMGVQMENKNSHLHIFSDASKRSYAAVVFLRVETNLGVNVQLLLSKSRVAPVKLITIPRLELLACTIAARLAQAVKKALGITEVHVHYWSDSSTALAWIKRNDCWGTFVGNRVKEILKLSKAEEWNFIPGHLNPADLPSRGIRPMKFLDLRWWEGPIWLKLDKSKWPNSTCPLKEEEIQQEKMKSIVALTAQVKATPWFVVRKSYCSNLRIIALVCRFLDRTRKLTEEVKPTPSVDELNKTEVRLLKLVQQESIAKGDVIHGVQVQKDNNGLIRVKTRLTNRQDLEAFKEPILLPNSHPFVDLLIQEAHVSNSHAGVQCLMGVLREKFWVVGGRRAVKRIVRACVICQRFSAKHAGVPRAALPEDRVKDTGAFDVTGIDLMGALEIRNATKVWIVLFTCAVFRCIHLELVLSLSTEDFLLAFVRFCKRKRRPKTIYTDNGSNFIGAHNLFKTINWEDVERRTQRIHWKFIPPAAPWWGGWWERLVRSVKELLKRILGFRRVNLMELETCLCEVESVVNHRPLTFVTEDHNDLIPLTPALFIYDLPDYELPESQCLELKTLENKKRNLDKIFQELRNRFRKEYLSLLVQRGKEVKVINFKVGDFVFVEREDRKRILWPMARIIDLIPGHDGLCRIARVRTKNGELLRPLNRLYPLEIHQKQEMVPPIVDCGKITPKAQVESERRTRSGRLVRKPITFVSQY